MVAVVQRHAFKPGRYKGQLFTADRLRQFAEGTNKALAVKVPIPALKKHATVAADDKETDQFAATDGAGWLKKLDQEADGSLSPHFDVPEEIAKGISDGTIKFTSPEFREHYEAADGRYSGPITRHWAFTPLPKAHDQGALAIAMSEGVFQFGEDDYEGPPEKDGDGDGKAGEGNEAPPKAAKNPDLPPQATDKSKIEAARAGMATLGIVLPSDYDFGGIGDDALDVLLTGLNTACKAKAESEAKSDAKPDEPEVKESSDGMPFSEAEISAAPPAMRDKLRKANEQAKQFSEERKSSTRQKAIAAVNAAKLPAGLKSKLVARLDSVQFSETAELPAMTVQEAATLFAECIPPLASEDEGEPAAHPDGEQFHEGKNGELGEAQVAELVAFALDRKKTAA